MFGDSTHIVCERLSAMQELARLREFFAHFGQNTLFLPRQASPFPGLELPMEDPESLGLRPAESPPTQDWNTLLPLIGLELPMEDLESLCVSPMDTI